METLQEPMTSQPVALAEALLAVIHREQDRSAQLGRSTLDAEALRSVDRLTLDIAVAVRGLLNSHSSVNRLPAELLLKIFAYVPKRLETQSLHSQRDEYAQLHYQTVSDRLWEVKDLCPLTAVCRQWRELALATQSLWSTLSSDGFSRSRSASYAPYRHYMHLCPTGPLYVKLCQITKDHPTLKVLEEVRERVRELYVEATECVAPDHILPVLQFPNLERCAWYTPPGDTRGPYSFNFCDSPHLRTLELYGCTSIPSTSYPALTYLSIIGPCLDNIARRLLRLLSSTPRLRVLIIGILGALPSGPPTVHPSPGVYSAGAQTVHLPFLRHFEFKQRDTTDGSSARMQASQEVFLSSLSYPSSCDFDFECTISPQSLLPAARLLPNVRTATRLSVSRALSQSQHLIALEVSAENRPIRASFGVRNDIPDGRNEELLLALRVALSAQEFSSIHKLSLSLPLPEGLGGPRPRSILSAFPHLSLLRVGSGHYPYGSTTTMVLQDLGDVLEALRADPEGDQADGSPPACPQLKQLWIDWPESLSSDTHDEGQPRATSNRPPQSLMNPLRALALARAARGCPLAGVFITHSPSPLQPETPGDYHFVKMCTVEEYDGNLTHALRSRTIVANLKGYDYAGRPFVRVFREEWDRVEGGGV